MIGVLFAIALVALILLTIAVKCMAREIDELKEKLEHHRIKLKYLDDYTLPEHERRLDQLEEVLNEEENIND